MRYQLQNNEIKFRVICTTCACKEGTVPEEPIECTPQMSPKPEADVQPPAKAGESPDKPETESKQKHHKMRVSFRPSSDSALCFQRTLSVARLANWNLMRPTGPLTRPISRSLTILNRNPHAITYKLKATNPQVCA